MNPAVPAVFLDRDGVVNEIVWRDGTPASPRLESELVILPGVAAEVARLRAAGYRVFVVTNQPDIARGKMKQEALAAITSRLRREVALDDVLACPHDTPDGCDCRKPSPGMVLTLARHWSVDLARSYVIGDGWRDMQMGRAAGCRTILLRRPYNVDAMGDLNVATLEQAVDLVTAPAVPWSRLYLDEAKQVLDGLDVAALERMAEELEALRARGGRLFFLGVGGGAGHAAHAVCDFRKIAGIEAYCATENVAELTARTNDDGWDSTFVEYLRGSRVRPEDGVFVFSVGGGSREHNISTNLVRALEYAREVGATIFGVVGRDGGATAELAKCCVVVPTVNAATVTPHTESTQALVWHLLVSHPRLQRGAMKWESMLEQQQ